MLADIGTLKTYRSMPLDPKLLYFPGPRKKEKWRGDKFLEKDRLSRIRDTKLFRVAGDKWHNDRMVKID